MSFKDKGVIKAKATWEQELVRELNNEWWEAAIKTIHTTIAISWGVGGYLCYSCI